VTTATIAVFCAAFLLLLPCYNIYIFFLLNRNLTDHLSLLVLFPGVHSVLEPLPAQEDACRLSHASKVRPVRPVVQHGHVAVQTQAVLRVEPVAVAVVAVDIRRRDRWRNVIATTATRGRGHRRIFAVRRLPAVPAVPAAPARPPVLLPAGKRIPATTTVPDVVRSVRAQVAHGHADKRRRAV